MTELLPEYTLTILSVLSLRPLKLHKFPSGKFNNLHRGPEYVLEKQNQVKLLSRS